MLPDTKWGANNETQRVRVVSKAIVLTSGGLDSATVLAVAHAAGKDCFSLSIDYGQRHRSELAAAERVAAQYTDVEHRVVKLDLSFLSGSALTDASVAVRPATIATASRSTSGDILSSSRCVAPAERPGSIWSIRSTSRMIRSTPASRARRTDCPVQARASGVARVRHKWRR